jgi:PTH1 family peptidyl-tRNA hydrolase
VTIHDSVPEKRGNEKVRGLPSGKQIVVVGLGNPGKAYADHRHNIGFAVVDTLAQEERVLWEKSREKAETCQARVEGHSVVLVKPQTFMNLSGRAVLPTLRRFNADPARMIVLHDDMDLARGTVRIKVGGGDGGHKGIRSITDSLRFRDFIRIRLGVGRPPAGVVPEEFVLTSFCPDECEVKEYLIREGTRAVRLVIRQGVELAQNVIHSERLCLASGGETC